MLYYFFSFFGGGFLMGDFRGHIGGLAIIYYFFFFWGGGFLMGGFRVI